MSAQAGAALSRRTPTKDKHQLHRWPSAPVVRVQAGARLSHCVAPGGDLPASLVSVACTTEQLVRQGARADSAALYVLDAPSCSMATLTSQHGFSPRQAFPIWLSCTAETVTTRQPWSGVRLPPPSPRLLCPVP